MLCAISLSRRRRHPSDEFAKLLLRTLVQIAMLTSSVFFETSIPSIPSITVLSFHLISSREPRFEQPCTQDLRSRASQWKPDVLPSTSTPAASRSPRTRSGRRSRAILLLQPPRHPLRYASCWSDR